MLKIAFHGGMCCGVKTIQGFPWYPEGAYCNGMEPELFERKMRNNDKFGHNVSSEMDFFNEAAPKEKTLERLDRYLKFLREHRPKGAVEVCLAEGQKPTEDFPGQIALWHDALLARGFKVTVPKFINSNSKNWVQIYHLVMDEAYTVFEDEDEDYDDPFYDEDEEI